MSQFDYKESYQRNLPHWQPPEATLFITFRLDSSIPLPVLEAWRMEKKQLEMTLLRWAAISPTGINPDEEVAAERQNFHRRWFKKFEALLDGGKIGPLWLQEERIAKIVDEALRIRDGKVYRLDAYCVMPNHVHAVFAPLISQKPAQELANKAIKRRKKRVDALNLEAARDERVQYTLASIMQSLKGWTAHQCNLALGHKGPFWQHESFDHVIRNQVEWERTINYVLNNPVKAGFVQRWQDWKWNYRRQSTSEENKI